MTVTVQTSYSRTLTAASAGQPASEHRFVSETMQVDNADGIGFGLVVSRTGTGRDVGLGGTVPLGISVRDVTRKPSDSDTYLDNADIVVLTKGDIWVTVEDDVAVGDVVEYNTTTGQLGSDGGTTLLGAKWMTSASAGNIALLRVAANRSYLGEGAPINSVAPALSGTPTSTHVLTSSNGTWNGAPTSYTYQWQKDGVNIMGQTANTYTILVGDVGHALRCVVTAHNAGGATSANSNAITPAS